MTAVEPLGGGDYTLTIHDAVRVLSPTASTATTTGWWAATSNARFSILSTIPGGPSNNVPGAQAAGRPHPIRGIPALFRWPRLACRTARGGLRRGRQLRRGLGRLRTREANFSATDGNIVAQRFDPSAQRVGNQFTVNSVIAGSQIDPDVAMDAEGDFVIVWSGPGTVTSPTTNAAGIITSTGGVFGQYYNSFGVPQGEFKVYEYTVGTQDHPAVAMDQNGDFVVTWNSYNNRTGTPDRYGVWARRYNYLRQPQPMTLATEVAICCGAQPRRAGQRCRGRLSRRTPTWPWTATATSPSSGKSRRRPRHTPPANVLWSTSSTPFTGTTRGNPFEVNTYTSAGQIEPRIAMDPTVTSPSSGPASSRTAAATASTPAATTPQRRCWQSSSASTRTLLKATASTRPTSPAIPTGRCHGGQRPHGGYLEHRRPAARCPRHPHPRQTLYDADRAMPPAACRRIDVNPATGLPWGEFPH